MPDREFRQGISNIVDAAFSSREPKVDAPVGPAPHRSTSIWETIQRAFYPNRRYAGPRFARDPTDAVMHAARKLLARTYAGPLQRQWRCPTRSVRSQLRVHWSFSERSSATLAGERPTVPGHKVGRFLTVAAMSATSQSAS